MKRLATAALIVGGMLVGSASTASAATVSGIHQTAGGKVVDLSGLEWLTWDETANLSRTVIEDGTGNTFLADGWRYATRGEVEALFDSLWGGTVEGLHPSNSDGAQWILNNLDLTTGSVDPRKEQYIFFGTDNECSSDPAISCVGRYLTDSDNGWGYFKNEHGLSDGVSFPNINDAVPKFHYAGEVSSALVRVSEVPLPAALPLLLSALGIFGFLGWRRKAVA